MKKCIVALVLAVMLGFACQLTALAEETEQDSTAESERQIVQQILDKDVSAAEQKLETWGTERCKSFLAEHGWEIVNEARSIIEMHGSVSQEKCIDFALGRLQEFLVDEASAKDPAAAAQGWSSDVISTLMGISIDDLNASNVINSIFTSLIKDWIKETIGVEIPLPEYYAGDITFVNHLIRAYNLPADVASTDGGGVGMWIMSAFAEFDDSFPKRLKGIRIVMQNDNPAPLDLTSVSNLEWTYISGGNCSEISVKELDNLTNLEVRHANNLRKINAGGCVALQSMFCDAVNLEELVVSHTPKLEKLKIPRHKLSSLNLEGCPHLTELTCTSGRLETLNVDALKHLRTLECSGNQLKVLDVAKCGELEVLRASSNQLESVVLGSALKTLRELDFSSNKLTELSLNNGLLLEKLWLNSNPLERLHVTNNPVLETLQLGASGKMRSIDLHGCAALKDLEGSLKGEFTYLNIENCISLEKSLGFQISHRDGMSSAARIVNVNGCTLQASCEDHNGIQMLYSVTLLPSKGTVVLNGNTLNPPNIVIDPPLPMADTMSWYNKAKEFLLNQDCTLVMWYGDRFASADPTAAISATPLPGTTEKPSSQPTASLTVGPSTELQPSVRPAPVIPEITGYESGRINGRNYYVKTAGTLTMYYLRSLSGRMVRVSAPYTTAADGTRFYPVNYDGAVLFPRLEDGDISCYCLFAEGLETPVLNVASAPKPVYTDGYQTGRINGRDCYVKTSGASLMFYLKSRSGRMVRVSAPYVTAADGTRYYPVNHGGAVLFPKLSGGGLASYETGSGEIPLTVF